MHGGGFNQGFGGHGHGHGGHGGHGGPAGGAGGAGRQIYVANVCGPILCQIKVNYLLTRSTQLPFNVGWQDLKDLFRQAGKL